MNTILLLDRFDMDNGLEMVIGALALIHYHAENFVVGHLQYGYCSVASQQLFSDLKLDAVRVGYV